MSKFLKIAILLFFVTLKATAQQPYLMFIDKDGKEVSNKGQANSYVVVQKLDDSAWMVKEFDLRDTILSSALYKDEKLTIPTGKFIAYEKRLPIQGFSNRGIDTLNHIKTSGYFLNGKKTGVWYDFLYGKKRQFKTYKDDIEDGLSQTFNPTTGVVYLTGNYVKGQKSGIWHVTNDQGVETYTECYKNGKMTDRVSHVGGGYKNAVMLFDLTTYLKRRISVLNSPDHPGTLILNLNISEKGTITDVKVEQVVDQNFEELVVKALKESPGWKPAEFQGKKIASTYRLTIDIVGK